MNRKPFKLYEKNFRFKESFLKIKSENLEAIEEGLGNFLKARLELESYIELNPMFRYRLDPYFLEKSMPEIVKRMVSVTILARVGPLASVAGALADITCETMVRTGAFVSIVEDGGEISVTSAIPILIKAHVGSPVIEEFIFEIEPKDTPLGIASSSSTKGGGITFGSADLATVFAENAALADAAATKLCNMIKGRGGVDRALRTILDIPGVRGGLIVVEDLIGYGGWLPRLVRAKKR